MMYTMANIATVKAKIRVFEKGKPDCCCCGGIKVQVGAADGRPPRSRLRVPVELCDSY